MAEPAESPYPDIAAIVVTYRTGPILRQCLARLGEISRVAEIVLVDNGNPPAVVAELRAISRLNLLTGHGNIGFAAACNRGAAVARAPYFAFVNPDVVLAPDALDELTAAGAGARSPWIAGARLVGEDGAEQRGARRERIGPAKALGAALGLTRIDHERDPVPAGPIEVGAISGAAFLMRAADFQALGGFDEGYFLHVEDIDLCRRAQEAGGAVLFQPAAMGVHHRSSSAASALFVESAKAAGFARYFLKFANTPLDWISALIAAPLIAIGLIARALWRDLTRP